MGYKVGLTEEARDDLGAAVRFIAVEGKNPEAALRLGPGTGVSPLVATPLAGAACCWRQLGVAPARCTHASLNRVDPCRNLAIRNAETSD